MSPSMRGSVDCTSLRFILEDLCGIKSGVARKNTPLVDKSCSSSLNGLDLEQMSYNKVGRLPLEVVEIWNESL